MILKLICLFFGHDWQWYRLSYWKDGECMDLWFECTKCGLYTTTYKEKRNITQKIQP